MRKFLKEWWLAALLFGSVFIAWNWWRIQAPGPTESPEIATRAGQRGDWFGSLNALFSGLAFAGLIVTLQFQRRELELQRHELELNRKAVQGSEKQLGEQATALQKQVELMNSSARLSCIPVILDQLHLQADSNRRVYSPDKVAAASLQEVEQTLRFNARCVEDYRVRNGSAPETTIQSGGTVTFGKNYYADEILKCERLDADLQEILRLRAELRRLYTSTQPPGIQRAMASQDLPLEGQEGPIQGL